MLFMCCSHASRVTSRGWGNFVLPTPVADDAASFLCACCFASSASRAFAALASRFASVAALYATAKVPGGGRGSTESKQYNVNAHIFELKSARSSDRSRGEGERREKEGRKKGERREKEGRAVKREAQTQTQTGTREQTDIIPTPTHTVSETHSDERSRRRCQ